MALTKKIIDILRHALHADFIHLDDEDGIYGYIVTHDFDGMSALDRQYAIEGALRNAEYPLTRDEMRRVLMIAGLTPAEYAEGGPRGRIQKIKKVADGTFELLVYGGEVDAENVRYLLGKESGFVTTEPEMVPGKNFLMKIRVQGTPEQRLTKAKLKSLLMNDQYIEVRPSA